MCSDFKRLSIRSRAPACALLCHIVPADLTQEDTLPSVRFDDFWVMSSVAQNELVISVLAEQSNADFEIFFGSSAESLLVHDVIPSVVQPLAASDELNILDLDEPVNPHR